MAATLGDMALNGMNILDSTLPRGNEAISLPSPFLLLRVGNIVIPTCKVASRIKKEHILEDSL